MRLRRTIITLGSLVWLLSPLSAGEEAQGLFEQKCGACHMTTQPTQMTAMVAPPVMGVMRHVKMAYPQKEEAVNFMVDYVLNPSKEKAVCKSQKIAHFGLMPSQKGEVSKQELTGIVEWMYDNFPSKSFRGQRGMKHRAWGQNAQ